MIANDPVQCQASLIIFCAVIFDIPPKINPAQSHTIQLLLSFSYVLDDIKEKYLGLSRTLNNFHHVSVVIDSETQKNLMVSQLTQVDKESSKDETCDENDDD